MAFFLDNSIYYKIEYLKRPNDNLLMVVNNLLIKEKTEEQYNWDLKGMYATLEEWEKVLTEIPKLITNLLSLKGKITTSSQNLYQALTVSDQIGQKLDRSYRYARMLFDVNTRDPQAKDRFERIDNLYNRVVDQLAFFEPELITMSEETYERYQKEMYELRIYNHMFEKLFKTKEHVLTTEMEELLAKMGSLGGSFEKVYDDITHNDLQFTEIEGPKVEKVVANESAYSKSLISFDRPFRERYFKALLKTYGSHINSITSAYYGNVKHEVYVAKTRKYASSLDKTLSNNFVPTAVYDNLIDTVRANVKPLHKYIQLRKKTLGLKDIHFYDLFVPIVQDGGKTYSYEEAKEMVLNALEPLGKDYVSVLQEAFANRWIDVYPKEGKTPGAYATASYGVHPYSLLNYTGTLNDVFTLAHELGHVMHSYYSMQHQPFVNAQYTIFTAEVASTVNEALLYDYLLKNSTSKEEKALLLSKNLDNHRSTLYRQTFFADFERQVHSMVEQDIPLTPEALCNSYKKLYEIYYGPQFQIDDELKYEWARIPHFYSAFYVYQYATGVSAAISIAKNILKNNSNAVKAYRSFLTTGGSDYPIELLKIAGLDMSSPQPILDAIKDFEETIDELAKLL